MRDHIQTFCWKQIWGSPSGVSPGVLCPTIIIIASVLLVSTLSGQTGFLHSLIIKDLDGRVINGQKLLKKGPVLIDFWALWCAPCLAAMPHIEELQTRYKNELTVLFINIDSENSRSKVRRFIKTRSYRATVALDPAQDLFRRLNGITLPYTLLIAEDGRITYRHIGYNRGDEDRLATEIINLLINSDVDSVETLQPAS